MRGRSLSGYQHKRVWLNDGAGHFTDVAQAVGATDTLRRPGRRAGRSLATAACSTCSSPTSAARCCSTANTVAPGRHWIAFDLEGTASNRSAIGARVEVQWDGQRQVQEVTGGSGFSAQNQRRLHFGLGEATRGGPGRHPLAVGAVRHDRAAATSTAHQSRSPMSGDRSAVGTRRSVATRRPSTTASCRRC